MLYTINQQKCIQCGSCEETCMENAISNYLDFYLIDPLWCKDCGSCAAMCSEEAIRLNEIDASNEFSYEELEEYQVEGVVSECVAF